MAGERADETAQDTERYRLDVSAAAAAASRPSP